MNDAKSNSLEDKVLNHFLGISSQTFDNTIFLALFTTNPTDAGSGTEATGGSYARQSIAFDAPVSGTSESSAAVEFAGMPALTISHWGIYTASTAGDLLYYGEFNTPKTTNVDDTLVVPAAGITITEK